MIAWWVTRILATAAGYGLVVGLCVKFGVLHVGRRCEPGEVNITVTGEPKLTPAAYALSEAMQYAGADSDQPQTIDLEDFLAPPSGQKVLIVTGSQAQFDHVVRTTKMNPANVKLVRYRWQLDQWLWCEAQRVIVLGDAYLLPAWNELHDAIVRKLGARFVLLST